MNDLRTFAFSYVEEAHAGYPVAVPAFYEFFGTDEDVEGRCGSVNVLEEGGGIDGFDGDFRFKFFYGIEEFCGISNVNFSKYWIITTFHSYFSVRVFEVEKGYSGWGSAVEDGCKDVFVNFCCVCVLFTEVGKTLFWVFGREDVA